jgi:hypothetical protein
VNDLRERLDKLAEAGAQGIEVTRPELASGARRWWQGGVGLVVAAATLVIVVGTAAALVAGGGEPEAVHTADAPRATPETTEVTAPPTTAATTPPTPETTAPPATTPPTTAAAIPPPGEPPPPPPAPETVAAVTYGGSTLGSQAVDLRLHFVDGFGNDVAWRSWDETGGRGALLQAIPAGHQQLTAILQQGAEQVQCSQTYRVNEGQQVILRLSPGLDDTDGCATVEPVADWVAGRTGPTGAGYVGLSQAAAEAQAAANGLTTRVVGLDGADLVVTMDLRTDRLNLMVFDGIVVAARLDNE